MYYTDRPTQIHKKSARDLSIYISHIIIVSNSHFTIIYAIDFLFFQT